MVLTRLRLLTAGESHGPRLTGILEGLPAGLALEPDGVNADLARRQRGYGAGGRMKIETDTVTFTGGWMAGRTTGGPLAFEVVNRDFANWVDRDIPPMTKPRPGHADLVGAIKYGHRDLRLSLERASARETAMRVVAGGVCRQLLGELGVEVVGYVVQIGDVRVDLPDVAEPEVYRRRAAAAAQNDLACPDADAALRMRACIKAWRQDKDTIGGVIETVVLDPPPGLGSFVHYDRRLDARLAGALMSIPAMKGVEIGPAFANAGRRGTKVHDEILRDDAGRLYRESNRSGGLEGGVTTGSPLVLRSAMKPISTTPRPRRTVDLATKEPALHEYERSDFCAVPRAVPIGEAMAALVIADALLEKVGGDSLDELRPRFEALTRSHVDDLEVDDQPWRFGYRS